MSEVPKDYYCVIMDFQTDDPEPTTTKKDCKGEQQGGGGGDKCN